MSRKERQKKKTECVIILPAFLQKRKYVSQVSLARLMYILTYLDIHIYLDGYGERDWDKDVSHYKILN